MRCATTVRQRTAGRGHCPDASGCNAQGTATAPAGHRSPTDLGGQGTNRSNGHVPPDYSSTCRGFPDPATKLGTKSNIFTPVCVFFNSMNFPNVTFITCLTLVITYVYVNVVFDQILHEDMPNLI